MMRDHVGDDEELYRRVPEVAGQPCYQIDGGRVVFKTAAFNDAKMRPSMDRAKLRLFDPHRTRLQLEDGIVVLRTDAIRRLGPIVQYDNRKRPISEHTVDVSPDPVFFTNCAHALVKGCPAIAGNAFKRLKDGLVRLANEAGWRVEPRTELPLRRILTLFQEVFRCLVYRFRRN